MGAPPAAGGIRVAFLGSGAFGVPSAEALQRAFGIVLVITQPDRPAGRGRVPTPTPVAAWAAEQGIETIKTEDVNGSAALELLHARAIDTLVVIAFGQKIGEEVLRGRFAVNLHGSLLPRWRGAAPIQRALMAGDREVGVSVISIAPRMDGGLVYATAATCPGEAETAGELHDRLAALGVEPLMAVVRAHAAGQPLRGCVQDESLATRARKLSRADAWVDLDGPARAAASRINGLSPWPGVDAEVAGRPVKLLRARVAGADGDGGVSGDGGRLEILEVQPSGGRVMPWADFVRGLRGDGGGAADAAQPKVSCARPSGG